MKIQSFFRQCEAARAAGYQACLRAAFQRCETLADDAERQSHLARGRGKAPRSDDDHERAQFGDVIKHRRF